MSLIKRASEFSCAYFYLMATIESEAENLDVFDGLLDEMNIEVL